MFGNDQTDEDAKVYSSFFPYTLSSTISKKKVDTSHEGLNSAEVAFMMESIGADQSQVCSSQ